MRTRAEGQGYMSWDPELTALREEAGREAGTQLPRALGSAEQDCIPLSDPGMRSKGFRSGKTYCV